MSLRGAKRRGNPSLFLGGVRGGSLMSGNRLKFTGGTDCHVGPGRPPRNDKEMKFVAVIYTLR